MELTNKELRDEICDACHKMWQLGWVAANDGNVSVKLEDGTFLATAKALLHRKSWYILIKMVMYWTDWKDTGHLQRLKCI